MPNSGVGAPGILAASVTKATPSLNRNDPVRLLTSGGTAITNPLVGFQTAVLASGASITTPSLTYGAFDLLLGCAYNGVIGFSGTPTWSAGLTNVSAVKQDTLNPGEWLNYAQPTSGASTTFGFSYTGGSRLGAIVAALAPAVGGVSPTFNATSAFTGFTSGMGPIATTLGSYTTVTGDCIVAVIASNGTGSSNFAGQGAGASWQAINVVATGASSTTCSLVLGFGCSSGQTTFSYTSSNTSTQRLVGGVFSGVLA
jgi:hypothetical protein